MPTAGTSGAGGIRGLRANCLAGLVMLLVEFGLGTWTNLYATVPPSDQGKATFAAFADAVAHGPVGLALHALLGTLLIVTAVSVVVRAALIRRVPVIVVGCIALLAIVTAWVSGAKFVGAAANGASFGMALAGGVAILGYATILFLAVPVPGRSGAASIN
jgi:uncharacterized membrane protein (UPF0182 family)